MSSVPLSAIDHHVPCHQVDKVQWQILEGRDPEALNFRNVEWHQYGSGGQLAEPGHYDSGKRIIAFSICYN